MNFEFSRHFEWITLDNAAKLFPAIVRKNYSAFFRFEVHLKSYVYADALQEALQDTLMRYPLFQTKLHFGLFLVFLEKYHHEVTIKPIDDYEPCRYQNPSCTPLWRIFAGDVRVAAEFSHILTDGIGALEFFKTLLCRYYELAFGILEQWGSVKHYAEDSNAQELELSYNKHRVKKISRRVRAERSFQYPEERGNKYSITHIILNTHDIKREARRLDVMVTSFIAAVHFYAVQQLYCTLLRQGKGLVRELLLVNLRPFFSSQTLRNFYSFIVPSIDFSLGHYDLAEIAKKINAQIHNLLDVHRLREDFSHYVNLERNIFNRMIPWFVKRSMMRATQFFSGETTMIGSLSNLGKVTLPPEVSNQIEHIFFCPPPSRYMGRNISLIGHKDVLTLTTGRYTFDNNIEKEIAKILLNHNIDIVYLEQ